MWYHHFRLEQGTDVPYNVNMTSFVATPGGSKILVTNWTCSRT